MTAEDFDRERKGVKVDDEEEDESNSSIAKDLAMATRLCAILRRWRDDGTDSLFSWSEPLLGSDVHLKVGDLAIPAHRTILCQRSAILERVLAGRSIPGVKFDVQSRTLEMDACHPIVALLLLHYIYTDDVAAVWDARVSRALQGAFPDLGLRVGEIKSDLLSLAKSLDLQPLVTVLGSTAKVPIPTKSLSKDLQAFFTQTYTANSPDCDVTLILADKEVHCSSIILRARCQFFEAMFDDSEWTATRYDTIQSNIVINMEHLKWRPMKLVFKYIHQGLEDDLFDYLHQETLDEFLDFVFEVLAAATELLLDRLVLICSRVITRHCNAYNAAALACEASFYQATTLKLSIFDYIIASMETMLESGLLDELHEDVLLELSEVIAEKQAKKLSVARTGELVQEAMKRQKEWLALQDIPTPRIRIPWKKRVRASPVITPLDAGRMISPSPSPSVEPQGDEMFTMDDEVHTPSTGDRTPKSTSRPMTPLDLSAGSSKSGGPVWRSKAVEAEKVDLRSIMAEAAASKTPARTPAKAPARSTGPASTPSKPPLTGQSPPSSGAWRAMTPATPGTLGADPSQPTTAPRTNLRSAAGLNGFPSLGMSTPSRPSSSGQGAAPPLQRGDSSKIITPIKLSPAPQGIQRKPSGGPAWSVPTTFAPPPPAAGSSPDSRAFSLLAIQQEEQDYAERSGKPREVKSFAEIQDEERRAEDKRKEEREFMKWWEEEQARSNPGQSGSSPRGGRGRGRGGRGRGRGGAVEGGGVEGGGDGGRGRRKVPPQRARGAGGRGGPPPTRGVPPSGP